MNEPFVLADVGCSGGIADYWRRFEPALQAFGFDPLVHECERLNRIERNPAVRFYDRFVGWNEYGQAFPDAVKQDPLRGWSNQPFPRTSAARLQAAQSESFVQSVFNSGNPDVKYTEKRTSLDEFFASLSGISVDFIKIDTDGHDYEVLCGAEDLLSTHQVLGLLVEVQFHGVSHPHANLFANIDRLLREHGFSLFDLEAYRYTRAVLPGHFTHRIAAQTHEGQVMWGEALYLRDLGAAGYDMRWPPALTRTKLLKLICLFEMFRLQDCAAEVLTTKRDALESVVNVNVLLDALAAQLHPQLASAREVNQRFEAAPEWFYPRSATNQFRRWIPPGLKRVLSPWLRRFRR